jgi:hypothetical protein
MANNKSKDVATPDTDIVIGAFTIRLNKKAQHFPQTPWEIFEDGKKKPVARCPDKLQAEKYVREQEQLSPPQSSELKRLIKADDKFLEKLEKYSAMPDEKMAEIGIPLISKMKAHGDKVIGFLGKALEQQKAQRKIFNENLPFFYEVKQRLLNPKFRPDLNPAGTERTPESNLKHFGARDWKEFREEFISYYSLSQADALLSEFKKKTVTPLLEENNPVIDPETGLEVVAVNGTEADHQEVSPVTPQSLSLEDLAEKLNAEPDKGKKGGGRAGKELDMTALNNAYRADQYDHMIGLILHAPPDTPLEEIRATLQATAQKEYEMLTPEQALAIKIPKIVKPSEVQHLGVELAKQVAAMKSVNKTGDITMTEATTSELRSMLFDITTLALQVLQAAGLRDEPDAAAAEASSS